MRFLLLAASVSLLAGCFWTDPPEDDAGSEAFVRQAVPAVLGRKVRNNVELRVLSALHAADGDAAVLDWLMAQDEYTDYWRQVLVDALQVYREGQSAVDGDCFPGVDSTIVDQQLTDELVAHVRDEAVTQPFTDQDGAALAFTMSDVLHAAVEQDALDVAPRAFLFPLGVTANSSDTGDLTYREDGAQRFLGAYVDRDSGCMGCHTTVYSTTDANSADDWDRHAPMPYDLEGSVMHHGAPGDADYVWGGMGAADAVLAVENHFRTDQFDTAGAGAAPWGMAMACVSNGDWEGYTAAALSGGLGVDSRGAAAFAGSSSETSGVAELLALFSAGVDALDTGGVSGGVLASAEALSDIAWRPLPVVIPAGLPRPPAVYAWASACAGCHHSAASPSFEEIATYYQDGAILNALQDPPSGMTDFLASEGLTGLEALADVVNYIENSTTYTRPTPVKPLDDAAQGYAWMVAQQLVDDVVHEVWGERLVLEHGFPRNETQALALHNLTSEFVSEGWSLRALLTLMLTSDQFNRTAPAETTADDYQLAMLANPWAADDGTMGSSPEVDANGQGDLVNRFSVPSLLLSARSALGWGPVHAFGPSRAYPTDDDQSALGRPWSATNSGVDIVTLQSLWQWEQTPGSCSEHMLLATDAAGAGLLNAQGLSGDSACDITIGGSTYVAPECWDDWIDTLVAEVDALASNANPSDDATLETVVVALKDRLLGDAVIDPTTEQPLLEAVYGTTASFSDRFDGSPPVKETRLREICGAMTRSPQFMLRQVANTEPAIATDLVVCMNGEECDEATLCAEVEAAMGPLGYGFTCAP